MNTIHHFGDSYGVINFTNNKKVILNKDSLHFIEICANKLNKKYINYSVPGNSNEVILKNIIEKMNTFKKNDIVFIQFSYFCRGNWWNETTQTIENTNSLYDEQYDTKYFERANNNKKLLSLVNYYLNYTEDYARRIFDIINVVIKQLITMEICVFFIHIDDDIYECPLLNSGYNIKFEKGFGNWLSLNKFHNEEEAHYTKGTQSILSKIILDKTKNFTNTNKNIYIENNINKTIKNLL